MPSQTDPFDTKFSCSDCGPVESRMQAHHFDHERGIRLVRMWCPKCNAEHERVFKFDGSPEGILASLRRVG